MPPVVHTLGHGTRSAEELIEILREAGVESLADVRRFPASRRHPQHNRVALAASLGTAGIDYIWLGESLGGRRKASVAADASPNGAWKVAAFRHYADAMPTAPFQEGFAALENLARASPTALMCAERLWWRCHRRLLADMLVVRGFDVMHLLAAGSSTPHELTEFARVKGDDVSYPALL